MFCPKCKSILRPMKDGNKKFMGCSCGYKENSGGSFKEEIKKENKIEVVREDVETLPLVDAQCPECRHEKAYFWSIQTRASDEPETRFFRCEKCRHTWKEYT